MTTLSLRSSRVHFETDPAVVEAVKANGELEITAGQMAQQDLPEKEIYAALATALGTDTPIFRFRPRTDGSSFPISTSLTVFAQTDSSGVITPKVFDLNLSPIETTFLRSKVGPGGYAIVKIGKAEVEVEIPVSSDLMGEVRAADEGAEPVFEEAKGEPALEALGVHTLRAVPQREIPPHSNDVPVGVDLEVVELLAPTRDYGEPRLKVARRDTGEMIVGLIATSPIRAAIGVRNGQGFKLDNTALGQTFQVLEVATKKDRQGEPIPVLDRNKKAVLDDDGNARFQQTVIVRRTTGGGSSLKLAA